MSGTSSNKDAYHESISTVEAQVQKMNQRADQALQTANSLIGQLSSADNLPQPAAPPTYDDQPDAESIERFEGTAPDAKLFGDIDKPQRAGDPGNGSDLIGDLTFDDIDIPEFTPSVSDISIPSAPAPADVGPAPAAPTLTKVDLPDTPDIKLPSLPSLRDIEIPEFEFPTLPTFDAPAPEFSAPDPDTAIDYQPAEYESESLDEVKSQISSLMKGGTGIPKEVEDAIFARTVERADQQAGADIQSALEMYASRGWDMPPGAIETSVRQARDKREAAVAGARRDVLEQASKFEIENLRFAVEQGLAVQQLLSNIFDNTEQRAMRLAELRQQADMALFNAKVSLFNARQQSYQVQAQVFGQRLNAALSKLEVYKAQIEGQKAIGELNQQSVAAYSAQVQAVRERVGIYTARMQGAEIMTRSQGNEIDRYRAEVDAYGKRLEADKSRFDAFEAIVRGESAKADLVSSQARAFASTIEGIQTQSNMKIEQIRARISAVGAATERFQAKVGAERDFVASQASAIQAKAQAYSADVSRYSAEVDADRARNELQARINQDRVRNALAFYDAQIKQYDTTLQRINQQANIKVQSVTAAGQMASQLAAGAMSAVNIGASISGSASDSVSRSETYYHDESG